ncbi:hypothetical protein NFI96_001498 [Prochilodus magdalenae]|nr:hypothetical protein NFI96_001498 [Prochilodus magdalenae]
MDLSHSLLVLAPRRRSLLPDGSRSLVPEPRCRFGEGLFLNVLIGEQAEQRPGIRSTFVLEQDIPEWSALAAVALCVLCEGVPSLPGAPPSTEVPAGPYPFIVKSDNGQDVPVVQAYAFGKYLGYLKVTFDSKGNVIKTSGNPILLDSSVTEDPDIKAQVDSWKGNLANYSSQYVGRTLVYLNGTFEECRFRECNLGNMICDAMKAWCHSTSVGQPYPVVRSHHRNRQELCTIGRIFELHGMDHHRTPLGTSTMRRSITMEDVIGVLPFGGTFDLVQMKGSTLFKAFEHSVHRYGGNTGEFLQVSGFQIEYDLSQAPGKRVKTASVLCTECRVPRYEPVDPNKVYRVAVPSYLVDGGDGYSMIKQEMIKHDSGDLDISVLASYISERKRVHPAVEGRIRFVSSASGLPSTTATLMLLAVLWALCMNQ